jgi:hypothetical protein
MDVRQREKPGIGEWVRAGEVLADRLTECVHVYKHNTYSFMSESDRQNKSDFVIKILHRIHKLLDKDDKSSGSVSGSSKSDEETIGGFQAIFRDALKALPWVSIDMQKLLKSPWMKGFPDKIAESLFLGNGEDDTGIGSGYPDDGRLPGVLADLFEREDMGEIRPPREDDVSDEPSRRDEEARSRWHKQNNDFLRKAGRVD